MPPSPAGAVVFLPRKHRAFRIEYRQAMKESGTASRRGVRAREGKTVRGDVKVTPLPAPVPVRRLVCDDCGHIDYKNPKARSGHAACRRRGKGD